jgi:hypothetical protein
MEQMPKTPEYDHHEPRKIDKKKRHHRGFTEDVQEKRAGRVGFKNYLRRIREEELEQDHLNDDDTI